MQEAQKKINDALALVLSAGGARAAYQVGVLKTLSEEVPEFTPRIFSGVSAGSINASFLAQDEFFLENCRSLYDYWFQIEFDQVVRTNFATLLQMGLRWVADLFLSKITGRILLKSLLDASPLTQTLLFHTSFPRISRSIREGRVMALAVTATNYHTGFNTVFYESFENIDPWTRHRRVVLRTSIRVRHIMASCSIPILFEPVVIGDTVYGDGSIRINFPFSPVIHLGAKRMIGISVHGEHEIISDRKYLNLGLGYIAGSLLNSIFLDSLEYDFDNLNRINQIVGENSARYRPAYLIRPSKSLSALAVEASDEMPFHLRQLMRSTAPKEELGELLSYLMFSPGFLRELLKMGSEDAKAHVAPLKKFLKETEFLESPVTQEEATRA